MKNETHGAVPVDREMFPLAEAAARLGGISRVKIYELIHDGIVETITVGRRRFVSKAALLAAVERLQADSRPIETRGYPRQKSARSTASADAG